MEETVRTYRGRSLEEVLPQIREELGADAIVVARREGLAGGVGGFFQRQFVEVEARRGLSAQPTETAPEQPRNDRATAEGLATPAVQELLRQTQPFAAELESALDRTPTLDEVLRSPMQATGAYDPTARVQDEPGATWAPTTAVATPPAAEPAPAPAPVRAPAHSSNADASGGIATAAAGASVEDELEPVAPPAPAPAAPTARPNAAEALVNRLVAGGLSTRLAAELVDEARVHGVPFGGAKQLRRLTRTALARRLRVLEGLGGAPRALAAVGAGGAGKTQLIARLAEAYARAGGVDVLVVALRPSDGGAALERRFAGTRVDVVIANDGAQARERIAAAGDRMVLIDTPAIGPKDRKAATALAADLESAGVEEVHVCLPGTLSAPAARTVLDAAKPLGVTHVALTHADAVDAPGAVLELCLSAGCPLSYVTEDEDVAPADPSDLAGRML